MFFWASEAVVGLVAIVGIRNAIAFWHNPGRVEQLATPPAWWRGSLASFHAFLRTIPSVAAFVALMFVLGMVSDLPVSSDGATGTAIVLATVSLTLLWFAVMLIIVLVAVYNRPKWAVPPRFRAEVGMASRGTGGGPGTAARGG